MPAARRRKNTEVPAAEAVAPPAPLLPSVAPSGIPPLPPAPPSGAPVGSVAAPMPTGLPTVPPMPTLPPAPAMPSQVVDAQAASKAATIGVPPAPPAVPPGAPLTLPPLPQMPTNIAAPVVNEMGAAQTILPQLLASLEKGQARQEAIHAETLAALGAYSQALGKFSAEVRERLDGLTNALAGALSDIMSGFQSHTPQITTSQPVGYEVSPHHQMVPAAGLQPNPETMANPAPVPPAPASAPSPATDLVARNQNFRSASVQEYLTRLARNCTGYPYNTFVDMIKGVKSMAAAFPDNADGTNDLVTWLQIQGFLDGAGIIRV